MQSVIPSTFVFGGSVSSPSSILVGIMPLSALRLSLHLNKSYITLGEKGKYDKMYAIALHSLFSAFNLFLCHSIFRLSTHQTLI